jgi:hypothetical protein
MRGIVIPGNYGKPLGGLRSRLVRFSIGDARLTVFSIRPRKVSAGEGTQGLNFSRRDIFMWAVAILFFNQIFAVVKEVRSVSLEKLVTDLGAIGIFQYMAWYAVFRLLGSSDPTAAARWRHFLSAAALCSLVFLPTTRMIWVAATGISVCLWIFSDGDGKLRAAGTVLGALSAQELWGHVFFNLVALPALRAETAVVGTVLEAVRAGTVWQDNIITGPGGFGIEVYTGCSSFHNLSLAMLCWVTVSKLRRQDWQIRDLAVGAVIGGAMILLNLARLYLMAWDIVFFYFWHDGMGAEIFAIGASLMVLLISLYGSRLTGRLA